MKTHEAVQALSRRAQRTATRLYVVAAVAMVVTAAAASALLVLLQWALFGMAWLKPTVIAGVGVSAGVVVPVARRLVRGVIAARREAWIKELAQNEGLNAAELGSYFTLDSW